MNNKLDCAYTAGITPTIHGLSVKLSVVIVAAPPGQIAALSYMCGHIHVYTWAI